jgi:hypothetical protein
VEGDVLFSDDRTVPVYEPRRASAGSGVDVVHEEVHRSDVAVEGVVGHGDGPIRVSISVYRTPSKLEKYKGPGTH